MGRIETHRTETRRTDRDVSSEKHRNENQRYKGNACKCVTQVGKKRRRRSSRRRKRRGEKTRSDANLISSSSSSVEANWSFRRAFFLVSFFRNQTYASITHCSSWSAQNYRNSCASSSSHSERTKRMVPKEGTSLQRHKSRACWTSLRVSWRNSSTEVISFSFERYLWSRVVEQCWNSYRSYSEAVKRVSWFFFSSSASHSREIRTQSRN